ncbi:MAG: hypothetical protein IIT97_02500 [Mycoplasmataceae bacterium]|nr:hypothetical protein [Mycoplasmataceae bacterium]
MYSSKNIYLNYNKKLLNKINNFYISLTQKYENHLTDKEYIKLTKLIYCQIKNTITVTDKKIIKFFINSINKLNNNVEQLSIKKDQILKDSKIKEQYEYLIKTLKQNIESLKTLKLIYEKEIFYLQIKKQIYERFVLAVDKEDLNFKKFLDIKFQHKIDYLHNAYELYKRNSKQKVDLTMNVSNKNFFEKFKIQ